MSGGNTPLEIRPILPYPLNLKNMFYRGEMSCLSEIIGVIYTISNIGANQMTYSDFAFNEVLWGESIGNDSNDLCHETPHIIRISNIGGSNV